jgi:hypothetical protein
MKTFLFLAFVLLLFSSCTNTSIKPKNPLAETTAEILEIAKADTNYYKVVYLHSELFVLHDNVVKYKVSNDSGVANTLFLLALILLIVGIMIGKIF